MCGKELTVSHTSPSFFTCLQLKSYENTVEKEEITRNEQFLLSPYGELSAILTGLKIVVCKLYRFGRVKFVVWERVDHYIDWPPQSASPVAKLDSAQVGLRGLRRLIGSMPFANALSPLFTEHLTPYNFSLCTKQFFILMRKKEVVRTFWGNEGEYTCNRHLLQY